MYRKLFKRVNSLMISFLLMILFSPLFILISLFLIISYRSLKIFYISRRVGTNYKIFNFYKFRTMKINCPRKENFVKLKDDNRITWAGQILRRSSLDELPQLLNVFLGDMHLVGNRPLPISEASDLYLAHKTKRFKAPSGITGWWQINKEKATNLEERIKMDEYYSDNYSSIFDLKVLVLTPFRMFKNY